MSARPALSCAWACMCVCVRAALVSELHVDPSSHLLLLTALIWCVQISKIINVNLIQSDSVSRGLVETIFFCRGQALLGFILQRWRE